MNTTTNATEERWKEIEGYPNYLISDQGRIKNQRRDAFLNPSYDGYGYKKTSLCRKGVCTSFYVHRLVAKAFISNFNPDWQIRHINNLLSDNRLVNLTVRLDGRRVQIIETGEIFPNAGACAKHIKGDRNTIYAVLEGRKHRKSHKGFTFRYYD